MSSATEDRIATYRSAVASLRRAQVEVDAMRASFFSAGPDQRPTFAALMRAVDDFAISVGCEAAAWRDLAEAERDAVGPSGWRDRSRLAASAEQPPAA